MDSPFFLAALPQLTDEMFSRSVVLIGHHDDEGAFGLLLNKPLLDENNALTQMITEVKDPQGNTLFEFREDIFEGGPVNDGAIFALHEVENLGTAESDIGKDLFLATDPEVFQKLLEQEDYKKNRRFYVGCSSWEGGQLESELRSGSWLMVPYDRKFLFDPIQDITDQGPDYWRENLWKRVLTHGGVDPLTIMNPGTTDSGYN